MELCDRTATELVALLKKREISAQELCESVFNRIDSREAEIHAYITLNRAAALDQARRVDQLGTAAQSALAGIPIAIKDNICTRELRTTCGSKMLAGYVPPYDATAVSRLLHQGSIISGKTNLDEFGMGSSTEASAFGPTRNPVQPDYVAGGSSGGSAAAVAAGEAILALGTDTGGSIRQPAAFCGVVGIKPTYGRVSRFGLISYASSLDQIGVLARSVADCALALNVICGHDPQDSTSVRLPAADFSAELDRGVDKIRLGVPKEYFVQGLDLRVKQKIMQAVERLEQEGAEIVEISLPHTRFAISCYYLIATAEASSNLARYDGVRYGFRAQDGVTDTVRMYEQSRGQGFGSEVKRRIMLGSYVLSAGYYDAYYLKAQQVRTLIKNDFDLAFQSVDAIIAPVTPTPPFRLGEKLADPLQMYLSDIYTVSLNLAGLPGLSINCGQIDGLPIGFQIIGKAFAEALVLRVAAGYERLAPVVGNLKQEKN